MNAKYGDRMSSIRSSLMIQSVIVKRCAGWVSAANGAEFCEAR
jgi:hypothetical protein